MRVPLIDAAALVDGQVSEVDFFGRSVLVLRSDERVRAFMNVCMHLGGPLELSADGTTLQCQWHGACFDARNGKATGGPARPGTRLLQLPVKIDNGQVTYVYAEADEPPADTDASPPDDSGPPLNGVTTEALNVGVWCRPRRM